MSAKYREDIDGLRAIAILLVLLFHQGQCRTRLDDVNLLTFDQDHFSPKASDLIGKQFFDRISQD